jgi:hypothetical protein
LRRFYQHNWQGIHFRDFAKLSSTQLATAEFYDKFYEELFRRYNTWEELTPAWRAEKAAIARFVLCRLRPDGSVLSVGCGLGAVEHFIREQAPETNLSIHEVAPSAWRWIRCEVPESRQFLGWLPDCLPSGLRFDLIYLSAVDYAMEDSALVSLLAALRGHLTERGSCMLFSASFERQRPGLAGACTQAVLRLRDIVEAAMDWGGLRHRGQFWGWMRTTTDYRRVMLAAGYSDIEEGWIDSARPGSYWIAGRPQYHAPFKH